MKDILPETMHFQVPKKSKTDLLRGGKAVVMKGFMTFGLL
jgi:hypothetical protein